MAILHKYRHKITGLISEMTEDAASVFPDVLTLVDDDAKPFAPGMFDPDAEGAYSGLNVGELKDELGRRELPTSGNKDELIARLTDDDAEASQKAAADADAEGND